MECTASTVVRDELIKNTDLEAGLVVVIALSTSTVLNSREMIVEDRISNGYFDGSVKQKLDSAPWLVAGWLTFSVQKEISADCKEERGPLQRQVLGKASKRADSGAQSLKPTGGGPAKLLRRSSQQSALRIECTASAVVRVRESNLYFYGMRPCSYFD
ncbi:hypothetical protein PIB30_061012 [Stylosanthes scabra]|uniref:Uncharacterized protein n=1 Tax=Stylosanthes scabra TaxID=79078 RepID=A0ABU6SL42_9FABA|nr:hypothetical protein [Stylosanthes scabra]